MSTYSLQVIPRDPTFVPVEAARRHAEALMNSFVGGPNGVTSAVTPHVVFFHPGENWMGVQCPYCNARLEDWWDDAMDSAANTGFTEMTVRVPCCNRCVSLNDLSYVWDCGFARFVLDAEHPRISTLTDNQLGQLAATLGCALKQVCCLL